MIKRVRKRKGEWGVGRGGGDRQEMGDRENRLRYREDSDIHRQIRQTAGKTQTEVADNETVTDRIRHRQTREGRRTERQTQSHREERQRGNDKDRHRETDRDGRQTQ